MRRIMMAALVAASFTGCVPARRAEQKAIPVPDHYVYCNEDARQEFYGRGVRLHMRRGHFDRLDAMADSLRATDPRWPSGESELRTMFTRGFGEVNDAGDADSWAQQLDQLRDWVNQRPQSANARIALAQALIGRAWAARGHGWSRTVSDGQWDRFLGDLEEAGQLLRQAPAEAKDRAEWFDAETQVLHGLGSQYDSEYRRVKTEAIQHYPHLYNQYSGLAGHLMPRWYGEEGEWQKFLESATREYGDSLADEMYARVVFDHASYMTNIFEENPGLSWNRTRQGLDDWHRRWPESTVPNSALALLAWKVGAREDAARAFAALGDTIDADIWNGRRNYDLARSFANGGERSD